MNLLALLLLLLVGGQVSSAGAGSMILMEPEVPLKKCRYSRAYGMFQAQCRDLKLNDVPANLQSSIEILDASENRIRELRNDTLSRYSSLKFLYIQDNFVQQVAEGAFQPTYYLEVLNLSDNGLFELPRSLFQLQSLRNLYVNSNKLGDSSFNVSGVRSPLNWLHASNNQLTRLPRLAPLAMLTKLNVSHNHISRLSSEDIAPLCSLQLLDLTGNPLKFSENNCECHEFNKWIKKRSIQLIPKPQLECPSSMRDRCSLIEFSNRTMSLYSGCLTNLRDKAEAQKARSTWIWIASCIGAFVSCICLAFCCLQKRNRNKRQRLKEQEIHAANNANTEQLLNKDKEIAHEQS
ncbi:hypothetical protein TSAR_003230 [Trichomalopsis sarcophagae]|uniref:LRRCT domain-containing protein n=1 Tax=Trichomalopsis sarcophagae TaxID=543379 RepID=A0A232EUR3_9HYME|nr:hypothetical protein TSAR_003230 [Trichomalopsis sarcophagae]